MGDTFIVVIKEGRIIINLNRSHHSLSGEWYECVVEFIKNQFKEYTIIDIKLTNISTDLLKDQIRYYMKVTLDVDQKTINKEKLLCAGYSIMNPRVSALGCVFHTDKILMYGNYFWGFGELIE